MHAELVAGQLPPRSVHGRRRRLQRPLLRSPCAVSPPAVTSYRVTSSGRTAKRAPAVACASACRGRRSYDSDSRPSRSRAPAAAAAAHAERLPACLPACSITACAPLSSKHPTTCTPPSHASCVASSSGAPSRTALRVGFFPSPRLFVVAVIDRHRRAARARCVRCCRARRAQLRLNVDAQADC